MVVKIGEVPKQHYTTWAGNRMFSHESGGDTFPYAYNIIANGEVIYSDECFDRESARHFARWFKVWSKLANKNRTKATA